MTFENNAAIGFKPKSEALIASLAARIPEWEELLAHSSELVLFGSRARSCERPSSDWDLLVIGGPTIDARPQVDFVFLDGNQTRKPDWLGSELGSHVATYGTWLKGGGDWRGSAFVSEESVAIKAAKIAHRVHLVAPRWDSLSAFHQARYLHSLRRDLQRLEYLVRGSPVPPTPRLDQNAPRDFLGWLATAEGFRLLPNEVKTQVELIALTCNVPLVRRNETDPWGAFR